ncbi:MAG: hypothetical protein ACOC80_09025 [Petrotogales bacterium]
MANPFAKSKKKSTKKTKKDEVIIKVPKDLEEDFHDWMQAKAEEKEAKARKTIASGELKPFAIKEYSKIFAKQGSMPGSIKIGSDGKSATFVVQNKCGNYELSEEQEEMLRNLLGDDVVDEAIDDKTTYSFNSEILEKDGVMDFLVRAINKLVEADILTEEEAEEIVEVNEKHTLKKTTMTMLAQYCDSDQEKIEEAMIALDKHCNSYLK